MRDVERDKRAFIFNDRGWFHRWPMLAADYRRWLGALRPIGRFRCMKFAPACRRRLRAVSSALMSPCRGGFAASSPAEASYRRCSLSHGALHAPTGRRPRRNEHNITLAAIVNDLSNASMADAEPRSFMSQFPLCRRGRPYFGWATPGRMIPGNVITISNMSASGFM